MENHSKTTTNDDVVLQLKKQVEDKKKALKAAKEFRPKTNCSIVFNGSRINLRVAGKEELITLLVHLNALWQSAMDLGVQDEFSVEGYNVQDWIDDLRTRLTMVNIKQEEARLKVLEDRLVSLLSADKKVELELEELKKLI